MKVTGTFEVNEVDAQAWLNTIEVLRIEIEGLKGEIKQLQLANTDLETYLEKLEKRVEEIEHE